MFGCAIRKRQRECVFLVDRSPNGTYLGSASEETEKMGLFAIADVVVIIERDKNTQYSRNRRRPKRRRKPMVLADEQDAVLECVRALKPRFFEGLTSSEVASIVRLSTKRRFLADAVMAHEGDPADLPHPTEGRQSCVVLLSYRSTRKRIRCDGDVQTTEKMQPGKAQGD